MQLVRLCVSLPQALYVILLCGLHVEQLCCCFKYFDEVQQKQNAACGRVCVCGRVYVCGSVCVCVWTKLPGRPVNHVQPSLK